MKKNFFLPLLLLSVTLSANEEIHSTYKSWYYPSWVESSPYNKPLHVRDTDSALGRYNIKTKDLTLETLTLAHGHLCDGLTVAYVALYNVLQKLFPDGIIDRTDLRVVSKNSPCLVDAAALMSGARINFKTLSVDNSMKFTYIVQRISTQETYEVHLKKGVFPKEQEEFEHTIRELRKNGKVVTAKSIDRAETMANQLIKKMLNHDPKELLEINSLPHYHFQFTTKYFGKRSDVINKNMPR